MDLLPSNVTTLFDYQTKRYLKTICNLYIKDSQDLKKLVFQMDFTETHLFSSRYSSHFPQPFIRDKFS